jgi:hypothetical protein
MLPVHEALHCAECLQCPAASKHGDFAAVAAVWSLPSNKDCLPCSTLAEALWQQHAPQLPHTLPDGNQMQQLIYDLPLRIVNTMNSELVTVESRVLQVPPSPILCVHPACLHVRSQAG